MKFVELNRCFVPIGKDEEPNLDIGRLWGRKIYGWLDWSDLLRHWRLILLAEASSGKSMEFRNHATSLSHCLDLLKNYRGTFIYAELPGQTIARFPLVISRFHTLKTIPLYYALLANRLTVFNELIVSKL